MSEAIAYRDNKSAGILLLAATVVAFLACFFAGWLPLSFSVVIVFLFAGPHNWIEARYMMTMMPGRWGKLRRYFLLGLIGVPVLTGLSILLPMGVRTWQADRNTWLTGVAAWNTLLVLWVAVLVQLRSNQNPRRQWQWVWPLGFLLIALNWMWPLSWSLALVYLHPLVAFWFLDREIGRRHAHWQHAYRKTLCLVPLLLLGLWWQLRNTPDLAGLDGLSMQITNHAGAGILDGISTHLLVATHTFLEMLHYGVWIIVIPWVTGAISTGLSNVPLAKRGVSFSRMLTITLLLGLCVCVALWAGFLINYPLTRDLYFSIALMHVLAEIPFLLRLL